MMNLKNVKLPIILIVIGMIVAAASCFLTCMLKEPVIKEHDFEYAVAYKLNGEEKTFEGVFRCSFLGHSAYDIFTDREYDGRHMQNGVDLQDHAFMIAQKAGAELYVVIPLDADYLMGDAGFYEYEIANEYPYLESVDSEGIGIEVADVFDAEIISWEYPTPIENSLKFAGFSLLHVGSMLVMMLIGALTILACIVFVKKDKSVEYRSLDRLSTVFNFLIGLVGIPFFAFSVWLMQLVMGGGEFMYQVYLCIPAMTAFTIAASIALRRKGFTRTGFFVQLAGPILFFVPMIIESFIHNLFM